MYKTLTTVTTSQPISPKKTRNKIKIEYDEKSSILKSETADQEVDETEIKKKKWEPKDWMQTLQYIRKMRKVIIIDSISIMVTCPSCQSGSNCSGRYYGMS